MRIGIHVDWGRHEAAYMAGQLADLAAELGHTVSILSTAQPAKPVCGRWDQEVLPPSTDFKPWAQRHRTIIWLGPHAERLDWARRRGCRNLLLMLWHQLTPPDLLLLQTYTKVICPTKTVMDHAIRNLPQANYGLAEWDTLTPIGPPTHATEGRRIFVPLGGVAARRYGPLLVNSLRMVAERERHLQFTLGHCQHWSRPTMQAFAETVRALPKRFTLYRRRSWAEWTQELSQHGWLFNPSLRESVGLTNIAAAYLRIPTAAFDIPPVGDLIRDGKTGMLIPCEVEEGHWGQPTAVPSPRQLVDVLENVLGNQPLAVELTAANTLKRLERRRTMFRQFWEAELEKTDQWA